MKQITKFYSLLWCKIFFTLYTLLAFKKWSLNPVVWGEEMRTHLSYIMGIITFFCVVGILAGLTNINKKN